MFPPPGRALIASHVASGFGYVLNPCLCSLIIPDECGVYPGALAMDLVWLDNSQLQFPEDNNRYFQKKEKEKFSRSHIMTKVPVYDMG